MRTTGEWRLWLLRRVAVLADVEASLIEADRTWSELGLASKELLVLAAEIEAEADGKVVSASLAWTHTTPNALAAHLGGDAGAAESWTARKPVSSEEPIALVGMACRFPGAEGGYREFWDLLIQGRDAITRVPDDRWRVPGQANGLDALAGVPRWAGQLGGSGAFDCGYFGIAPVEAARMNPQQGLLLEVAVDALTDAGLIRSQLSGRPVGVFVGASSHEFTNTAMRDLSKVDAWTSTGVSPAILANRVSHYFDLCGPSITIDTACSSSLVALDMACQSIRAGACEGALVAGVNLVPTPVGALAFSRAGAMAKDGRCKVFDASADGYVRSEGCGVVVLKRLSDAVADGSRIWGVIRGSATNSDGRSNGLLSPRASAQAAVIRAALDHGDVSPGSVRYVECHGTGTALGDPIEISGLIEGYGGSTRGPLLVGSVKSNIGHLEAAAGMAGLIKILLALAHRTIPPSIHYRTPNPQIEFGPTQVVARPTPWERDDGPRRAGLSGFGFGGSNAHVIVEEPPVGNSDEDPVWLFAGQASRWPGMARELLEEPVFGDAVRRVDTVIRAELGFSVHTLLASRSLPVGVRQVQPTLFAIQFALAELWRSRGQQPTYVVGHSMGEVAAAVVAGMISPEDGARIISLRARLLDQVSRSSSMALVRASPEEVRQLMGVGERVWIAGRNSASRTIIAGERDALDSFLNRCTGCGVASHRIDVDVASHCPVVDPILAEFEQGLAFLSTSDATIPMISTVRGSHPSAGGSHWIANLRQPVDFEKAVGEALALGVTAFCELSPEPALLDAVAEVARNRRVTLRAGLRRGRPDDLPNGRLWRRDPQSADLETPLTPAPLPGAGPVWPRAALMVPADLPVQLWRSVLDPAIPPGRWHTTRGLQVAPAAGLLGSLLQGAGGHQLEHVSFDALLAADKRREVLTVWHNGHVVLTASGGDLEEAIVIARADSSASADMTDQAIPTILDWMPPEDPTWRDNFESVGRQEGWVAVRVCLDGEEESRRNALREAASLLPSLDQDQQVMPRSITWVVESDHPPRSGTATVAARRTGAGEWDAWAWDVTGHQVLAWRGLSAIRFTDDAAGAMHAALHWTPTGLDTPYSELWEVNPAHLPSDPLAAAGALVLEARDRLAALPSEGRLAIVTRGVRTLVDGGAAQAALWGLSGVIEAEAGDRWAGIIDTDDSGAQPHALTVGEFVPLPGSPLLHFGPQDAVLVTGAFGGIGRVLCEHLVASGARALVLVTRGQGTTDSQDTRAGLVERLRSTGALVWVANIDLREAGAMAEWLASWRRVAQQDISLVVHAAGVAVDSPLADVTAEELDATLWVKAGPVQELTDACPHSRRVLFSSASSLAGVPGQASYAAANALADALARAAGGWSVVNWGPWRGLGLASGERGRLAIDAVRRAGWSELEPAAAQSAFDWAASTPRPASVVVGCHISKRPAEGTDWSVRDADARQLLITTLAASQLGIEPQRLDPDRPLAEYGLDSIMALRLRQSLEEAVGAQLSSSFLWNHPTVRSITTGLSVHAPRTGDAPEPGPQSVGGFEALLSGIEER